MKYFVYFLLAYFAFQFIFRLVIPLFLAGKTLRKGFRQMKEQMERQAGQQGDFTNGRSDSRSGGPASTSKTNPSPNSRKEDYLDFEEIK
ncbi:MAG: DUF4834 family protein [Bacteroidetes bacterium]|nr:DUF4834 family protein [Bacteroidota bacterium]